MAAAAATAAPDAAPAPKKGPSLVVQLGVLVATTLLAAGMGWFSGGFFGTGGSTPDAAPPAHAAPAAAGHGGGHGGGEEKGGHGEEAAALPGHPTIIPLAPINTNLAAPSDVWVRMELSLEFKEAPEPGVADSVHQDLLALVRSVRLHQIEGASGIMHFKADLDDRARIRSEGKVSRVLIRTLLFE